MHTTFGHAMGWGLLASGLVWGVTALADCPFYAEAAVLDLAAISVDGEAIAPPEDYFGFTYRLVGATDGVTFEVRSLDERVLVGSESYSSGATP